MRKEKEGRDRVVREEEEERWVVKGGGRQNETKMSHTEQQREKEGEIVPR